MAFMGTLCFILIASTIGAHFAKKIGIPAVIGQLVVGVIIGTGGLGLVHSDELVAEFSELGVVLLMFIAGIESDLSLLKKYVKPAVLVAGFGIVFPLLLGWGSGIVAGVAREEAIFLGIILAATSVSISVEVLKELRMLDTKEGSTILGASVIDDILTVLLVSISMSFLTKSGESTSGNALLLFGEQLLYFGLIYLLVTWIAPYLMQLSTKLYATAAVIVMSLVICLSMAYLADFVGLSSVIGAFFAGIAVGQTKVKKEVAFNTEAIGYTLFIPVFFISIGLNVTFKNIGEQLGFILIFTIIAVLSKLVGGYLGARSSAFSKNSAWMIGAGMVSRGEMALIILQLGSQTQLISDHYYSPIVIVILLTTLISPLILKGFAGIVYSK